MIFGVFNKFNRLGRSQHWRRSQIELSQLAAIRTLVHHAHQQVPLYREKYGQAAVVDSLEDFRKLPLLTKDEIRANFPDRIVCEGEDWKRLYSIATSGTTDRVMLFHDEVKRDWDRAADLFMELKGNRWRPGWRKMMIPPDACYERCGADDRGYSVKASHKFRELLKAPRGMRGPMAYQIFRLLVRDYLWRVKALKSLGVDGTAAGAAKLGEYLQQIKEWQPKVLSGLPQVLVVLARAAREQPVLPALIPTIRPMGGKMTHEMVKVVEGGLGVRVRENFGTAEVGTVAFDCARSRKQHLLGEIFYVEFLRYGQPVKAGELGELVITDLRNRVSPLIRYAVGDVGSFENETCACGFQGTRFTVNGRLDETIVTPEGQAFPGDAVADLFLAHKGVHYVKVIQQSDERFVIEAVIAGERASAPTDEECSRMLSDLLGYMVTAQLRVVRRIAPEISGKYRLVVSKSFHRFNLVGVPVGA